jgi:hypothetical protein
MRYGNGGIGGRQYFMSLEAVSSLPRTETWIEKMDFYFEKWSVK